METCEGRDNPTGAPVGVVRGRVDNGIDLCAGFNLVVDKGTHPHQRQDLDNYC